MPAADPEQCSGADSADFCFFSRKLYTAWLYNCTRCGVPGVTLASLTFNKYCIQCFNEADEVACNRCSGDGCVAALERRIIEKKEYKERTPEFQEQIKVMDEVVKLKEKMNLMQIQIDEFEEKFRNMQEQIDSLSCQQRQSNGGASACQKKGRTQHSSGQHHSGGKGGSSGKGGKSWSSTSGWTTGAQESWKSWNDPESWDDRGPLPGW